MSSELERVIKGLEELLLKGSYDYVGICCSADEYVNISIAVHSSAWGGWELFTGDNDWPVPSGTFESPSEAFNRCTCSNERQHDSWGDTPYGGMRQSLLTHIIERLKDGGLIFRDGWIRTPEAMEWVN